MGKTQLTGQIAPPMPWWWGVLFVLACGTVGGMVGIISALFIGWGRP